MTRNLLQMTLGGIIFLMSMTIFADQITQLESRVEYIESSQPTLKFFGWADFAYVGNDKKDNKPYMDLHHLYLIGEANIHKRLKFFSELEFEHIPQVGKSTYDSEKNTFKNGSVGDIKMDRGYIQYQAHSNLGIRFGKFSTPFGYWTPAHWAILVETKNKPIHENNGYVPAKQVGMEFFGEKYLNETLNLSYNLYVSNGHETANADSPADKKPGYGWRLTFAVLDDYGIGASGHYQQPGPDEKQNSMNIHFKADPNPMLSLQAEYIIHKHGKNAKDTANMYYFNVKSEVQEGIFLGYRIDNGEDKKGAGGKSKWGKNLLTHNIYTNWKPIAPVIVKLEYNMHKFKDDSDKDYNGWSGVLGVKF